MNENTRQDTLFEESETIQFFFSWLILRERFRQLAAPEENEEIAGGSFHHWHFTSDLLLFLFFWTVYTTPSLPRFFGSCVRRRGQPAIVQITLSALAFERAPARTGSRFISPGVGRILFWRVAPHVVALAQRDVRLQRWTGLLFHFKTTFDAGSVCNPGATHVYINRCYLLPLERSIHTLCSGGTFSCIFFYVHVVEFICGIYALFREISWLSHLHFAVLGLCHSAQEIQTKQLHSFLLTAWEQSECMCEPCIWLAAWLV